MFSTSVVLCLCSVVALSLACCTPDQWEGEEVAIGGFAGHRNHGLLKEYIAVAYDGTNNRTAAFLEYRKGEYSNKFQIVTKYEDGEGKLYVYDLKKDECWTKKLDRPFRKACIPSEAKSFGNYYLGLKGGFKLTGYEFKGRSVSAYVSVQDIDNNQCIPVSEAVQGRLKKVDFNQHIAFMNITPGIKNETVFHVPKKCERRDDFTLAEELTRDNYIMAI